LAAVIGALVVLSAEPPPAGRSWAVALLPLVVAGSVLTFIAVWIDGAPIPSALLAGAVGAAASLHAGRSRRAGVRGLIAVLWIIIALTLSATGVGALAYSVAFLIGAAAGAGVALLRAGKAEAQDGADDDIEGEEIGDDSATLRTLLTGPLGAFAALRGGGLAVAVLVGFTWFPSHPAWVAITAVLVMRPPTRQTLVVGVQRSLGTGVGVVVAVALAGVVGENTPGLVLLLLASAFGMMAVREVNYALFAMLVTSLVVYTQRILGADAAESGRDRFVETILGVAIAFVVLALTEARARADLRRA
jgi:hypothetical protein